MNDGVEASLFSQQTVKARKTHQCCECKSDIRPKTFYEKVEGLWDGEFNTYKTCIDCVNLRKVLGKYYEDDLYYGDLVSVLQEIELTEENRDEITPHLNRLNFN